MKKLYVVGIGPGAYEQMTLKAIRTLEQCDVIAGYKTYVDLIRDHFPGKNYLMTGMRREEERCRLAFEEAMKEQTVAMVCSGDAGVYGMSGLILEMGSDYPEVSVEIIGGVTAALSGAALLGAPLIHDFCLISLSDLLTPWETIEKRLECAALSDMVIVLYNPASKGRRDYLERACGILLRYLPGEQVCGIADRIGREGEGRRVLTLEELSGERVDMFSTVFIGNSRTRIIDGRMVTPRGYRREEQP